MSPTKKTEKIRRRKSRTKGKEARAKRRNKGTTHSAKELFGD